MGYCELDCTFLSSRHNCKKYRKGLSYNRCAFGGVVSGTAHERCSECEKDHIIQQQEQKIAELEEKIRSNATIRNK